MTLTSGVALAGLLSLGGLFGVDGNGKIKEQVRDVAPFTSVALGGGLQGEVRLGDVQKVTLVTDENLLPLITTTVKDGVLHVTSKQSIDPTRGAKVVIIAPTIDALSASGGTKLTAHVAKTRTFKLEGSGGAELDIKGIDTDALEIDLSGGVDAKLAGAAKTANVELSGGVTLHAKALQIDDATLDASGGVDAELAVTRALKGDASGGVSVTIKGRPTMNVDTGGGATVSSRE